MKFRCTSCHKEVTFESPMAFCPYCGGKMEEVGKPLDDASQVYYQAIETALSLRPDVSPAHLKPKSAEEESEFPSFTKIQTYVIKTPKIDNLFANLESSIKNIRERFEKHDETVSEVPAKPILDLVKKYDEYLVTVASKLDWKYQFQAVTLPKITAAVSVSVDPSIRDYALKLLDLVAELEAKVKKYIVTNSIYDNSCYSRYGVEERKKPQKPEETFSKTIDYISSIIAKKYAYDLLGDSSEQVGEMMKCLWESLSLVCAFSDAKVNATYYLDGIKTIDAVAGINEFLKAHYLEFEEGSKKILSSLLSADKVALQKAALSVGKVQSPSAINTPKTKKPQTGEEMLAQLIGLSPVKDTVKMIQAFVAKNKGKKVNLHMAFKGNPGTGKTEVARIIAKILHEAGALPTNKVVETDREGLVGAYVGHTAIKTKEIIDKAMGGVLFIDEAYQLYDGSKEDFGPEAIATLIKAMEDNQGKFCVILAGYTNELDNMIKANPGFESRIQFHVDFPNYSRDELREIGSLMFASSEYAYTDDAMEALLDLVDHKRKQPHFANAREIRNLIQSAIMKQNVRTTGVADAPALVELVDVEAVAAAEKIPLKEKGETVAYMTPEEQLAEMIGLASVKKMVTKIKATVVKNPGKMNLHMCFYGNPGTGKTEVARLLSTILYEAQALPEAKFVETDAGGLIGAAVGSTAPKTQAKVNEALGGVLFIDEAYSLATNGGANFGEEAIAVLLKEMEDKRDRLCVIMAGYKNEMQHLLSVNPGFESRIQFTLNFPDYSRDELKGIALLMAKKQGYTITDDALEGIARITDIKREMPGFANARDVRNILQQVIMNSSVRTMGTDEKSIVLSDVTEYAEEIGYDISDSQEGDMSPKLKRHLYEGLYALPALYKSIDPKKLDPTSNFLQKAVVSISDSKGGQGTGFLISPDGFILTCAHCVGETEEKVRVAFFDDEGQRIFKYFPFVHICSDKLNDVALLRIASDEFKFKFLPLTLKSAAEYTPTKDFVMAGYPYGGESFTELSVTTGKIASVNDIDVGDGNRTTVFADMFGKPGNSGSPIIDPETSKALGVFWGGVGPKGNIIPCFTPIGPVWELLKYALKILKPEDGDFGE